MRTVPTLICKLPGPDYGDGWYQGLEAGAMWLLALSAFGLLVHVSAPAVIGWLRENWIRRSTPAG